MRLGEEVLIGDRAAAQTAAASTSRGFIAGFTERGPIGKAVFVISLGDFEDKFGGRLVGDPEVYDCVDAAFHEAGALGVYVERVVGDEAAVASKAFPDGEEAPKTSITFSAKAAGEYGNGVKVKTTVEGGKVKITVLVDGVVKEGTKLFATQDEIVSWAEEESDWVDAVKGESAKLPKTQELALEGGKADLAGATGANLTEALSTAIRDLGPGQVSAPNFRTEEGHLAVIAHCILNNRRALLDDEIDAEFDDLVEHATALSGAPERGARYAAFFGSWAIIPGIANGARRTVPYSGVQMGIIAASEAAGNNPNKPAAGRRRGKARYAVGLVKEWTVDQIDELDEAGVTCAILADGIPCTFGDRTLVDTDEEGRDWRSFGASRLVMAVADLTRQVLQGFEFEQIDGHGYVFSDLAGEIKGRACMPFFRDKALYGELPDEAFRVNTGSSVNTPASIEEEKIKAQVAIRISPKGGFLSAEIVNVPIAESL
jgi:hypothetical protein